jgi:hypothetical protein
LPQWVLRMSSWCRELIILVALTGKMGWSYLPRPQT